MENASEGVTLQLDKTVQVAGAVNCYVFLFMDAQLNVGGYRLISALW